MTSRETRSKLWTGFAMIAAAAFPGAASAQVPTSTVYQTYLGDNAGDHAGASVAITGDLNSDGTEDVMFGSPLHDNGADTDAGRVRIKAGDNGANLKTHTGSDRFAEFGASVADAGDVNNDGESDVIIGAPFQDGDALASGVAFVYSKSTGTIIWRLDGEAIFDQFGASVDGGFQANVDGRSDFVVGAPLHDGPNGTDSGKAYVFSGASGTAFPTINGEAANDHFGAAVAALGDVNNDGRDDVLVGAPDFDGAAGADTGKAYVFDGLTGALLYSFEGAGAGDAFGAAVGDPGDVDGDGRSDIVVGAPRFDGGAGADSGAAYVYSGLTGTLIRQHEGEGAGDQFGTAVEGVGDALTALDNPNPDGRDEIAVGAPLHDGTNGGDSGKVYVFSGATGALARQYEGAVAGDRFGSSLGGGGDTNGDGRGDLVIGAPLHDDGAKTDAGAAYVYGVSPAVCSMAATTAADMRGPWRFSFMSLPVLAMLFAAGRERRRERG